MKKCIARTLACLPALGSPAGCASASNPVGTIALGRQAPGNGTAAQRPARAGGEQMLSCGVENTL